MTEFIVANIPAILLLPSILVVAGLLKYRTWVSESSQKKNPLTKDLLRGPGESLRTKIEDMTLDLLGYMVGLMIFPLMMYSVLLSSYAYTQHTNWPSIYIVLALTIAGFGYLTYKLNNVLVSRRRYALGLDAEICVGQELNLLMRNGYWVFHDFPANKFNIDHVVIGPNGVFAVETKGRPKRTNAEGQVEAEVLYDGMKLEFPGWSESKPLQQANNQAVWLGKWLTDVLGEEVNAHPILILPGWFIKQTKKIGMPVINGKNCLNFFLKYGQQQLTEKLVNQIVYQVDLRCRTVAPIAYRPSL